MQTYRLGAELFHEDRWVDRHDELIVSFHNSVNMPENWYIKKQKLLEEFH